MSVQELDRGSRRSKAERNSLLDKAAKKAGAAAAEGMSYIQINLGRSDGLNVQAVLRMLAEAASLAKTEVGDIELRSHTTFVELPSLEAAAVLEALNHYDFGPVRLRARLITPEKLKVLLPVEVKSIKHKNAPKERREAKGRRGLGRKSAAQRGAADSFHQSSQRGSRHTQKKDPFRRGGRAQRRNKRY